MSSLNTSLYISCSVCFHERFVIKSRPIIIRGVANNKSACQDAGLLDLNDDYPSSIIWTNAFTANPIEQNLS